MTLKSPRFKSVLLFKMQTRQIGTRIKYIHDVLWRDIYILNTQDVLVNVKLSAELNENRRHFYMEANLE